MRNNKRNSKRSRFLGTLALIIVLILSLEAGAYAAFDFNFNFNFDIPTISIPSIPTVSFPDLSGLSGLADIGKIGGGSSGSGGSSGTGGSSSNNGSLYWSQYDVSYLNSSQQSTVEQAKTDFGAAQQRLFSAGTQAERDAAQRDMDAAHAKAEAVRAASSGSYSGGVDGSEYIPLSNGGGGGSYGGGGGGYTPVYTYYTVTASAGKGGSISPDGISAVKAGDSLSYTITANKGYKVSAVTVDGSSVGAVSSYTFSNAAASHTISASFVPSGRVSIGTAAITGKDGSATVKSGYGIFASINTDYADVDNVSVSASYNFGKGNKTVTLNKTSNKKFEFPANRKSPTKSRCVYIPVDTKDGTYTVTFTFTATNVEGTALTATRTANITVKGNMYEDDFTGDRK